MLTDEQRYSINRCLDELEGDIKELARLKGSEGEAYIQGGREIEVIRQILKEIE